MNLEISTTEEDREREERKISALERIAERLETLIEQLAYLTREIKSRQ